MKNSRRATPTEFDVWGCRGSRSFDPGRSRVGNRTSCYSLLSGSDLVVIDAGRGLLALGDALKRNRRFAGVERVHVLVSHAHLDHWEGIKDADWFWRKRNQLEVRILGAKQAIDAIRTAYGHPLYVDLQLLARSTVRRVGYQVIRAGQRLRLGPFRVRTEALHHYSGEIEAPLHLSTLGFRIQAPDGAEVAYVSDHEPTPATGAVESRLLTGAHVAVVDSHFPNANQHAHGHGSQEYAAGLAAAHPRTLVLAGHHGPTQSDAEILKAHRRHRGKAGNFALAVEGRGYRFDHRRRAFVARRHPVLEGRP
jgi:phosphoribosyl 1,2-cyclic phosphodiesterase